MRDVEDDDAPLYYAEGTPHRSENPVQISAEARSEIERELTASDDWKYRRLRVRDVINDNSTGKIVDVTFMLERQA